MSRPPVMVRFGRKTSARVLSAASTIHQTRVVRFPDKTPARKRLEKRRRDDLEKGIQALKSMRLDDSATQSSEAQPLTDASLHDHDMSVDHNSSTRAKDKGNIFDHDADIDPVKQLATSESEVKRLKVRQHELRAEIAMLQQDIISKDRSRAENNQEGEELEQHTGSDQQSLRRHSARERRRERAMRRKVAMNQMAMREETMRQMAALTLET